jgi:H+/Cl- antiporter ClcA
MMDAPSRRRRLQRLQRLPLLSPRLWMRRIGMWGGAVAVSLIALGFARAADAAQDFFHAVIAGRGALVFLITPLGLAISVLLTRRVFPGAQGSGIPQTIAVLHMHDSRLVDVLMSLRVAAGKLVLTLLGLGCGASIGREGPTVQIGAAVMHALAGLLKLPRVELQRGFVLAGGAAGVAAAFNTPLAGVVFAIEELSHSFEARTSGAVLTCVILAGITTMALAGNYTYFGISSVELGLGAGWISVLACALVGGLAGGLFSQALISAAAGLPGRIGTLIGRWPVPFAVCCGLLLASIGLLSGGTSYGTGYAEARGLVEGHSNLPLMFPVYKLLATTISYISGIPGGIFAPSLAVGSGIGHWLAPLIPSAPPGAVVLLGMVAYFSGVVQAPITATIIVMEMTDNQRMTIPLLATAMLAFGVSRLVCRRSIYGALARRMLMAMERRPKPADSQA